MNLANLNLGLESLSTHTDLHSYFTVHPVKTIAETDAHKECDRLFEEMAELIFSQINSSDRDQNILRIILTYQPLVESLTTNALCKFQMFSCIDRARLAVPTDAAIVLLHLLTARYLCHLGISLDTVGTTVLSNN
jgi:hypothetical protein